MPVDAGEALEAIAEAVRASGTPFKVCAERSTLIALNSGELGESQVGKFCTIYPEDDAVAVELAAALVSATAAIRGPGVPTDFRIGGAVYARYGSFEPLVRVDRLGNRRAWIHLPDGTVVEDERAVPYREIDGVANPFRGFRSDPPPRRGPPETIGPGYRCIDVIRGRTTGSVFLALSLADGDARSPWRAIKQARAHTHPDEQGRDRRDRLRHEEHVLRALEGSAGVPRCDPYFDLEDDGYLPVDLVRGTPLIAWAGRALGGRALAALALRERRRLAECGIDLVRTVQAIHERGFLHRDLSANNVLVTADGRVTLIDFELAHETGSEAPPFLTGTPGFMRGSQLAQGPPDVGDDVHAVAACLVALLCGVDPRLLVGPDARATARRLESWTGVEGTGVWDPLTACFEWTGPRPPWTALERALTRLSAAVPVAPSRRSPPIEAARRALAGLAAPELRSDEGLPVSIEGGADGGGSEVEEIADHAHRGVAGVLYLVALGAGLGVRDPRADRLALDCITWLLARDPSPSVHLPGLFFGRAGWAVALDEAVAGGLLDEPARWDDLLASLLDGPLDWYDLTHGLAGQGLAALRLARGSRREQMLARAARCASLLRDAQEPDGSWRAPPGVPGLSGQVLPGFAHGVAGIVYFLATAAAVLDDPRLARSWQDGIRWLLGEAVAGRDGSLRWRYSDTQPAIWGWWCHGAPGIALALLRAYEVGGDEAHARAAAAALASIPAHARHANLTQCHGLAGLGQVLLEGWRVLGVDALLLEAQAIGALLVDGAHESRSGGAIWFAESFRRPTGDLMQGGGGPAHLLLCLSRLDRPVPPPLLLALDGRAPPG